MPRSRKNPTKQAALAWLKAHRHAEKADKGGGWLELVADYSGVDAAILRSLLGLL